MIVGSPAAPTFDPGLLHGAFGVGSTAAPPEGRVRSVVFHPSYAYEDLVMGLLPEPAENGGVTVRPQVGPLLELAHFAHQPDRRALLVCDEFNRGASAAIFGDTLALLDRDKRAVPGQPESGAQIATPYHHLEPRTLDDELLDSDTSLPANLKIIAAMNSADRSVAPLDAALRRRFSILFIEPDLELLAEHLGVPAANLMFSGSPSFTTVTEVKGLAVEALRALNARIEFVSGRDFLLGQSVFWNVDGEDAAETLRSLAGAIDDQVMGTLALSFTDNDEALAGILNIPAWDENGSTTSGAAANWQSPPESLRNVASPRLRPVRFRELAPDELVAAILSLL